MSMSNRDRGTSHDAPPPTPHMHTGHVHGGSADLVNTPIHKPNWVNQYPEIGFPTY